jgi:hypothetical protein
MAETPPSGSGGSWGNVPQPSYFQEPPSYKAGNFNFGPRVDFDALGNAWRLLTAELWTWVGAAFLGLFVVYGVVFLLAMPLFIDLFREIVREADIQAKTGVQQVLPSSYILKIYGYEFPLIILSQAFLAVINAGMMEMGLRQMEGRPINALMVFSGFRKIIPLFFTGVVIGILTTIGFALCYIPGFLVLGVTCFAPILIIRGEARGFDALGKSYQMLRPFLGMISLLVFCAQLLGSAGLLACGIGMLFTFPLSPLAIACTYRNFQGVSPPRAEGPSNYYRP